MDTRVMLDVLLVGAEHGDESERRLANALRAGPAVVNDVIAAELAPVFETAAELWSALADAEIELVPLRTSESGWARGLLSRSAASARRS